MNNEERRHQMEIANKLIDEVSLDIVAEIQERGDEPTPDAICQVIRNIGRVPAQEVYLREVVQYHCIRMSHVGGPLIG